MKNTICYAELRDPTQPGNYQAPLSSGGQANSVNDLTLSSIWISGHHKRATINGITAKQGEIILGGIKIKQIDDHSVVIFKNGKTHTLSLFKKSLKTL